MSSQTQTSAARLPKRARGKERVAKLLQAATAVFAEKGYEAATMTEIAARAGAPIGSLYQFFPVKESLADTLVQNYVASLTADLQALEARASQINTQALVAGLFGLLRARPRERAAAQPLAEARMSEQVRRTTFRHMLRKHVAAILRVRAPTLNAEAARDIAIVMVQLMKASNTLSDEEALPGRAAGLREIQALAVEYLDQRLPTRR
jgi:AcrR family transcriptional regulator